MSYFWRKIRGGSPRLTHRCFKTRRHQIINQYTGGANLLVIQIQSVNILAATFHMLRQYIHSDMKRNTTCCQKPQKSFLLLEQNY